jgi:hypothetical protein
MKEVIIELQKEELTALNCGELISRIFKLKGMPEDCSEPINEEVTISIVAT